jgi:DNA-binding NtrC family response regulator
MSNGQILVVDDEPDIRDIVREILADEGYEVTTADNAAAARAAFATHRPDLVLLDIWMPDTDGISLLKEWSLDRSQLIPVVMMSGHGTVETAVEAIRLGAYDFLEKPLSTAKLLVTVGRALDTARLRQENLDLRRHSDVVDVPVGKSRTMRELRALIERIAAHDSWVLITGEPGCGKEVAARYLHSKSARRHRPFVELNLGAVPHQNMAVQLFGAESGDTVTPGVFEQAAGGTLLLDQIGDLSLDAQARLLNVLEEGRFLRVGGTRPMVLDVRVLAVTNQNLSRLIEASRFRQDLYYRLNVVPLAIPSLREHREDVPELVSYYVDWLVAHERLPYRRFTTAALNLLRNHDWPGNIRELKNLVQRVLILSTGEEIGEAEVGTALGATRPAIVEAGGEAVASTLYALPLRDARDRFEKAYLEHHLKRAGGNVAEVAETVGMERTHLYRKLKGLGIDIKELKED